MCEALAATLAQLRQESPYKKGGCYCSPTASLSYHHSHLTRLSSASPPDTGQPGAIAFPEYNGLGSDDYECPRENFCL